MGKRRVKPSDVTVANMLRLKNRKQKEIRVRVYSDQYDLVNDWAESHGTSVANLGRKLVNYFICMDERRRDSILKNY